MHERINLCLISHNSRALPASYPASTWCSFSRGRAAANLPPVLRMKTYGKSIPLPYTASWNTAVSTMPYGNTTAFSITLDIM